MRVSSLNFHFENPPIFIAVQHGTSRWIEVRDADTRYDSFAIFTNGDRSFETLTSIATALTAAWSSMAAPAADHAPSVEA